MSLLPGRLLASTVSLDPHIQKVTAANGTTIDIVGRKRFMIKLNDVPFEADMLVSYDVEEAIGKNRFFNAT